MASHHTPTSPPLEELLAVAKAARALQSELDTSGPRDREAMIVARRNLRTALTNLDARN